MLEARLRELHQDWLARLVEVGAGFIDRRQIESDLDSFNPMIARELVEGKGLYTPPEGKIEPVEIVQAGFASTPEAEKFRSIGENLLSKGRVAVVLVAGGQGSRLGVSVPKGTVEVSPVRHKSLFQIHSEKILALRRRFETPIHFFIMTSRANDKDTRDYFAANNYFGLRSSEVHFFTQGMLPSFTSDGDFILTRAGGLFMNPDGHGGTFAALRRCGCIDIMKEKGIEELFYFQVDNPIVMICDPLFIGLHKAREAKMSSKILKKRNPEEKIGVIVKAGGNTCVIEYSDMPHELLYASDDKGDMLYWAGSIAIHMLNVSFVDSITTGSLAIPFHKAVKKIAGIDGTGFEKEFQGIKYESFLFDALPLADSSVTLEVYRKDEFAPVKNATGEDSLESSRQMQSDLHRSWLVSAGKAVPGNALVEICPLFADSETILKNRASEVPRLSDPEIYIG